MNQKKLDQAVNALLRMGPIEHKRPKKPAKHDLERKFKLSVGRKGRPSMKEVE